jgi:hypothetical protein
VIIYYYSVLLLCNWFVACYRSQRYVVDPDLIIARLYYTYALLVVCVWLRDFARLTICVALTSFSQCSRLSWC